MSEIEGIKEDERPTEEDRLESLKQVMVDELKAYLAEAGAEGGHSQGYSHHIQKIAKAKPDVFQKAIAELIDSRARSVWKSDTSNTAQDSDDDADLFSVNEVKVQAIFTFRDQHTPGGHRKVLAEFATFNHWREDVELTRRKGAQTIVRAEQKAAAFEKALPKAKGNLDCRIKDVADPKPDEEEAAS